MVPRSRATRAATSATSSSSSTSRCAPSTEASLRSARSCSSSSSGCDRLATQSRSRSAPSRWADRQARRTSRCELRPRSHQREQALADRLRTPPRAPAPRGCRAARRHDALGLHLLGDLAQGDLAQRRQVLDLEEVVERRLDVLAGIDLARPQARRSAPRGVRSISTTSSAVPSTESGTVSRTRTPVSSATWSLRHSRCWTLTVEKTSMPAASTSSMSS